jgi:hypothetical protein
MASRTNTVVPLTRRELALYDRGIVSVEAAVLLVLLKRHKGITARGAAHIVSDFVLAQIAERRLVIKGVSR